MWSVFARLLGNRFLPAMLFILLHHKQFSSSEGSLLHGTVLGHGVVYVQQCINILKKAGYDGAVSVEFEGVEECLQALEWSRENLEEYIA